MPAPYPKVTALLFNHSKWIRAAARRMRPVLSNAAPEAQKCSLALSSVSEHCGNAQLIARAWIPLDDKNYRWLPNQCPVSESCLRMPRGASLFVNHSLSHSRLLKIKIRSNGEESSLYVFYDNSAGRAPVWLSRWIHRVSRTNRK